LARVRSAGGKGGASAAGKAHTDAGASKSDLTRARILEAARKVFAQYPYKEASFRMIAREGGFDHPLINYYFPYKSDLFEAVVAEICDDFYQATLASLEGLERMSPREGFSLYLDRFLDFNARNPEPMRTILLNVAHLDRLEEIPGYQHIPEILARTRRAFEEKVPLRASPQEIGMFLSSFNALCTWFLGASVCQTQILGMEPGDVEYLAWVKETLTYLFLPRLEKLINPGG
jgi:TetR/AcrR family transcriptional regulator